MPLDGNASAFNPVLSGWEPRWYQTPLVRYLTDESNLHRRAIAIWARRTGKDTTLARIACNEAHKRPGLYLHMLPTHKQARKVVWDAHDKQGRRLLDVVFPESIGERNETEMKITLRANGSIWQLVGSDYYDSVVGSNPVGLALSEFALSHPKAWQYFRPILAENDGWAAFLTTPRGFNHAYETLEIAKRNAGWFWSVVDTVAAGVMTPEDVMREIDEGMPVDLARQEFLVDFSAANVGSIFGRQVERADREGRIGAFERDGIGRVIVSCDIGFHDTAAWWWWEERPDGWLLFDYDEGNGLDADDWLGRHERNGRVRPDVLALPHDARSKTFSTKRSALEVFLASQWAKQTIIVPQTRKHEQINAGRVVLRRCRFVREACIDGLNALREWHMRWDDERKAMSSEPEHDWSSHGAEGFAYGAQYVAQRVVVESKPKVYGRPLNSFTMDEAWSASRPASKDGL